MKRTIALLACLFALAACGNQADDDASKNAQAANDSDSNATAESRSGDSDKDSGDKSADKSDKKAGFANDKEKRSYALGMDIGNSLKELPVQVDMDSLSQGVRDVINGGDTKLTQQELDGVMQGFVKDMQAAQQKKAQAEAQTNQQKGEKFLAENKKKEGVKTTDSGLQYKVLTKGDGPSPDANDSVTVHYVGKLLDGTVFDSSRKRGKPVTFPVNAVIPGWTEALQLMKQGAKYELYIPAKLAYGERGAGAQIGPNETLIFEVELLKVDKKKGSGDDTTASPGAQGDQSQSQSSGQSDESDQSDQGQMSQDQMSQDQMSQDQSGESDSSSQGESSQDQMDPTQSGQDAMGQDQSDETKSGQNQMSQDSSGQDQSEQNPSGQSSQ